MLNSLRFSVLTCVAITLAAFVAAEEVEISNDEIAGKQWTPIEISENPAGSPVDAIPRIASDQSRPWDVTVNAAGDGDVDDPGTPIYQDPEGGGGGVSCIQNHKCDAGSICATGECKRWSGQQCWYCSATACKDVQCD